jgi:catechol 2,3-dioxygenase
LQSDNFVDWNASTEWMRTSDRFAKNPIGVFVDPSKVVAARARGAFVEELHRRAYAGELPQKEPVDIRIPLDSVPRSGARGRPVG